MTDRLFVPARSDVWMADFNHVENDPEGQKRYTRYREQADLRPCVILSSDEFNKSAAELVIVVPSTSKDKRISTHVAIEPPEGGLRIPSSVICEGIRSIARQFLVRKTGQGEASTMIEIESRIRRLLVFVHSTSERV